MTAYNAKMNMDIITGLNLRDTVLQIRKWLFLIRRGVENWGGGLNFFFHEKRVFHIQRGGVAVFSCSIEVTT